MKIPIEVSARHIHLSKQHLEVLFGSDYKLTKLKNLTLPCIFSAKETLKIKHNDKEFSQVRIVGPVREQTQVELSITDCLNLGIKPVLRKSGDLENTPGIKIIGPQAQVFLKQGVIVAWRHIHLNAQEAKKLQVKNNDLVSVKTNCDRGLVFDNVQIRVQENAKLVMHIDTDEGNAGGINKKTLGVII